MTRFFSGFLFLFLFLGFADAESFDSIENFKTSESQANYLSQLLQESDNSFQNSAGDGTSHYFVALDPDFSSFVQSASKTFFHTQLSYHQSIFSSALYARGPPLES